MRFPFEKKIEKCHQCPLREPNLSDPSGRHIRRHSLCCSPVRVGACVGAMLKGTFEFGNNSAARLRARSCHRIGPLHLGPERY